LRLSPERAERRPSAPILEVTGSPGDLTAVARHLRRAPDLHAVSILPLASGRMFVRVEGPLPAACGGVFASGAVCGTCLLARHRGAGGANGWELTWPGSARDLGRFLRRIGSGGSSPAPILRLRPYRPRTELTGRQAFAVETAFRLGYYAFPRRAHLGTIASALHVSRSTVAELLRRAEGKLLAEPLGPVAT
ncbi:Bacterio-opsin activator, HTH domain protein, partial [mine drainage metagenome]